MNYGEALDKLIKAKRKKVNSACISRDPEWGDEWKDKRIEKRLDKKYGDILVIVDEDCNEDLWFPTYLDMFADDWTFDEGL